MLKKWFFVLLIWAAAPAAAQEPGPALRARAAELVVLLRGEGDPAQIFTSAFLAQVPPAQVRAIAAQLSSDYGAVRGIGRIAPASATGAAVDFDYERGTVHMSLSIEAEAPHRINGLFVTGAERRGDTLAVVMGEARALPGAVGIAVARLGEGPPTILAGVEPDRPLGIGSAFKLFILAELSRQISAGERRWSDVVPLDRRSIPTGVLQTWPAGAPVTLHTLAAQMISISDNSASDVLLHLLGRENVERMMTTVGIDAPTAARNRPLISTLEMAAIKTGPQAGLQAWRAADEAGRRALLARNYAAIDASRIDPARFAGNPVALDVEWYGSAADMVRTMDWIRRHGDDRTREILAISPGLGAPLRGELGYAGFKGGSEPGLINLTWLVRNRAGAWHVVTASWNNPAAPVEEGKLIALMVRAIQLVR
jgi:beta-lactamase class A